MPHNPALANARLDGRHSTLHNHRVLALEGPDAAVFAQAQFMNDVAALAPGHWQWNGWLTPKGRVIALFALLKFDERTLWLLLPDADPAVVAARLQRFVFRSKLKIVNVETLHVSGALQASQWTSGAHISGDPITGVELDFSGDGGGRSLRISGSTTAAPDVTANNGFDEAWLAEDLRHGLPRLDASQSEHWTPQQLSLDRLQAYSVKKGCYPGQEIVARTHFLGQAKRGLVRLETGMPVAVGAEVRDDRHVLGTVVSAARGFTPQLLAVLPLEREGPLWLADRVAAHELALEAGLAR